MIAFRYKAILRRIVDGDTLICDVDLGFKVYTTQRVRLWGINTPETRTRNLEEKKKGLAAKERLTEIMNRWKPFIWNRMRSANMVDVWDRFSYRKISVNP